MLNKSVDFFYEKMFDGKKRTKAPMEFGEIVIRVLKTLVLVRGRRWVYEFHPGYHPKKKNSKFTR